MENFNQKDLYLENLALELKKDRHLISTSLSEKAKEYYFQLFNNVSYSLDDFIIKSNNRYLEVDETKIDNEEFLLSSPFDQLLKNFLNKKNIQFIN